MTTIDFTIIVCLILGLMYVIGWALQDDLKRIEKNDPKYRKHLKDKYGW